MWPKKVNLLSMCPFSLSTFSRTHADTQWQHRDSKRESIRLFDFRAVAVFITMRRGLASARLATQHFNKASLIKLHMPVCERECMGLCAWCLIHLLFWGSWSCGHPGDSGGQSTCRVFASLLCWDSVIWLPSSLRSQLSFSKPQVIFNVMRKRFWSLSLVFHSISLPSA